MENNNLLVSSSAIAKACEKTLAFINGIVDENSFVECDVFLSSKGFDSEVALGEGVISGYATVGGKPVNIFAQNPEVSKGSISMAHAEKIAKCIARAIKTDTPLISVIDSAGARIGEGVGATEAYAKILAEAAKVASSVPHFCVVKGNCVGMMASYVAMADFVFMADKAVMSVNSPMYLASKNTEIPALDKMLGYEAHKSGSDLAHFSFKNEADLSAKLASLLHFAVGCSCEEEATDDPNRVDSKLNNATASAVIASIADDKKVVEFCSDYAKEVKCAFAKINGIACGILATDSTVNDGYISESGLKKAIFFVEKLNDFDLPLISIVDSLGVNPNLSEELGGFAKRTAKLFKTIYDSSINKISVVNGKAIGYAYSTLVSKQAGFDYALATDKSTISPISSMTAVNTIYEEEIAKAKDPIKARAKLESDYEKLEGNPLIAAQEGYIDNVIEAKNLRPYLSSVLMMVMGI